MLTAFQRRSPREFVGSVLDPADPGRKLMIEILVDGAFHTAVRADQRSLIEMGPLHGRGHGFALALPDDLVAGSRMIEARVANTNARVGDPIRLDEGCATVPCSTGEVRWQGGLQLSGWGTDPDGLLSILVDGVVVDRVTPSVWQHVHGRKDQGSAARAFTAHLPERFADGQAHRCAVVTSGGIELAGSPFAVLAFPDPLQRIAFGGRAADRDTMRAALFDQLVPASIPFADYERCRPGVEEVDPATEEQACLVVLVGPGDVAASVASLHAQKRPLWTAVSLTSAEPVGVPAASLIEVLRSEAAEIETIVFALAGTMFRPSALSRLSRALHDVPEAVVAYPDVELRLPDGSFWPLAFPAFDRERMLEQGYCAHVFAARRDRVLHALYRGATDLYSLFAIAIGDAPEAGRHVLHLPGPAATLPAFDRVLAAPHLEGSSVADLARRGIAASATATALPGVLPAIRIGRRYTEQRTTIMIPTRNRRDLLDTCMASIRPALARHGVEVLILDNDTAEPDALDALRRLEGEGFRRLAVPGPFNFARMNNRGAQAATGTLLCLLNNDVQALDDGWLDTLMSNLAEPDVGAVAPVLLWPSRVVQHGGLVLGPRFEAAHAFSDRLEGDPGYGDLLRVAHECSAVTAACLLTRRTDYLACGGMDETHFPINFNDVDYCLKLRAAGRRVIVTPHARLIHAESSSRGSAWTDDRKRLFERERRHLQLKWGHVLADDPYYSPVLALTPQPYSALAGFERAMAPRFNHPAHALEVPDGF